MEIATGTVVNGQIVLKGMALPEGAVVTQAQAQEDELLAATDEIARGEFLTLEALLKSLPARG